MIAVLSDDGVSRVFENLKNLTKVRLVKDISLLKEGIVYLASNADIAKARKARKNVEIASIASSEETLVIANSDIVFIERMNEIEPSSYLKKGQLAIIYYHNKISLFLNDREEIIKPIFAMEGDIDKEVFMAFLLSRIEFLPEYKIDEEMEDIVIEAIVASKMKQEIVTKEELQAYYHSSAIKKINETIATNKEKTNRIFMPLYHFNVPCGWMNDPNGLVYFKGYYHIFYQCNPLNAYFETNHIGWGHARSRDLVHFENMPFAIFPSASYDYYGCWSGSAIVKDDILYLIYTGHSTKNGKRHECQCLAYSEDGITFKKYEKNPIIDPIDDSLFDSGDFRDPYVYEDKGIYRILTGTRLKGIPLIVSYTSKDLLNFEYEGIFYIGQKEIGYIFECPSIINNEMIMMSAGETYARGLDYHNISSVLLMSGHLEGKEFKRKSLKEVDHGLDFYAPQVREINGRTIMLAWLGMWGRRNYTLELNHGYSGMLTLPRELKEINGEIHQKPIEEIHSFFGKAQEYDLTRGSISLTNTARVKIRASLNDFSLKLGAEERCFSIIYSSIDDKITIDRSSSISLLGGEKDLTYDGIRKVYARSKKEIELELFIDKQSVEIFINGGIETMSSLFYFESDSINLFVESNNNINISCQELIREKF